MVVHYTKNRQSEIQDNSSYYHGLITINVISCVGRRPLRLISLPLEDSIHSIF
jgi:hypothetical protein